jgi:5-amino-6-(5-phosphoribosylamino)uracil reductase
MPRPYVLLSVAQSLDGYIDDPSPDRLVLSSPEDLDRVDEVRAGCDAIMVGAVTLRRDNPRLRVKSPERRAARKARGLPEELLRVIVTRSGKLGRDLRVWTSAGEKIVYCPDIAADALRETLGDLAVVAGQGDTVDLGALLDDLGARGIGRLMVEGGEQVHTQFLAADLADELHVTIGGFFVADPAAPRFVTPGVQLPQNAARRMQLIEVSKAGETAALRYMVRPKALSSPSRVPTHATPPPNSAGRVVFAAVRRCRTHRDSRRMSRFGNDRVYLLRDSGRPDRSRRALPAGRPAWSGWSAGLSG